MNAVVWRGLLVLVAVLIGSSGCGATLDIEVAPPNEPTPAPTGTSDVVGSAETSEAISPAPTSDLASSTPPPDLESPTPGTDADGAGNDGFALPPLGEVGQCFAEEQLGLVGAEAIACEEPHVAEVFAATLRTEVPSAPWPGVELIQADSSVFCNAAFGELTGVPGDISAIDVKFFRPDEGSWERGDREVACFVEYPEPVGVGLAELDPLRAFGHVSSYGLVDGDCVIDETLTDAVSLTLVGCDEPHAYEIYASLVLDEGPYPGEDHILGVADDFCAEQFELFVGIGYSQSVFLVENLWPTEQSWTEWGDRLVSCAITTDTPRSDSAEGSGI